MSEAANLDFTPLSVDEALSRFDFTRAEDFPYSREWFGHCQIKHNLYEYPTSDYVGALSLYLAKRVEEIRAQEAEQVRILEVAAGQGVLTLLLHKALTELGSAHSIRAVDDKSWRAPDRHPSIAESLDYGEAIKDMRPHIILGAWVPPSRKLSSGVDQDEDWTTKFRSCPTTQEYLLIGKASGYGRHASPQAWGQRLDPLTLELVDEAVPEYAQEGFERIDLKDLQPLQLCFMSTTDNLHPSETVVFRRTSRNSPEVV